MNPFHAPEPSSPTGLATVVLALVVVLAMVGSSTEARAQDEGETGAESSSPTACATPAHRQFDFWIGEWNVTSGDEFAGRNSIVSILDGCALEERWEGAAPGGLRGRSINIYDAATDRWQQTWADSSGTLLELDGGMQGRDMVMSGERPSPDGATVTHRITWTPDRDGSVRQLWETRARGGEWTVLFDGLYRRVPGTHSDAGTD